MKILDSTISSIFRTRNKQNKEVKHTFNKDLVDYLDRMRNELKVGNAVCNICGSSHKFNIIVNSKLQVQHYDEFVKAVNPRENIICKSCGSSSRDRMLIYTLGCAMKEQGPLEQWKERKNLKLFETTGRRGHPFLLEKKFDYYNTDYDPSKVVGTYDKRKFADLQAMPYENGLFDYIITSDVFEHVRLYERAFNEVFRVLKDGGTMVLTVPYVHGWEKTLLKVEPRGDEDIFLMEPEYHDEHTLVYRIYGRDLLELLRSIGFTVAYLEFAKLKYAISMQNIIFCIKDHFIDITGFIE